MGAREIPLDLEQEVQQAIDALASGQGLSEKNRKTIIFCYHNNYSGYFDAMYESHFRKLREKVAEQETTLSGLDGSRNGNINLNIWNSRNVEQDIQRGQ
jgi:hypothetical protein